MKGSLPPMAMVAHHTVHLMEDILIATTDTTAIVVIVAIIMLGTADKADTVDMGDMDTTEMGRGIMDQKWIMELNTEMETTRSTSSQSDGLVTIAVLLPSELTRKHAPTRKLAPADME